MVIGHKEALISHEKFGLSFLLFLDFVKFNVLPLLTRKY